MPNYDFHCKDCDHVWEKVVPIADRDNPLPCPKCESTNTERPFTGSVGLAREKGKVPDTFKDVLRDIKHRHRGNNINV